MATPRRPTTNPPTNPFMEMFGGVDEGKYPGKGMYRGPVLKGISQFNYDEIVDQIRYAIKNEVDNIGLVDNVQRYLWKDIENAFLVSISPKKQTYDLASQPELRSDEAEISGFNPMLDINPLKWAKDPEKMIQKTKDAWWGAFWNWEDLSSAVEVNLYNRLLDGDTREPTGKWAEDIYLDSLAKPVKKIYDEGPAPGKRQRRKSKSTGNSNQ